MGSSQFIKYSSTDAGTPPVLTGQAGSLTNLLRACLVDGYSGGNPGGWSNADGNDSGNTAALQAPGGTGRVVFINDDTPGSGGAKEALAAAWSFYLDDPEPVGSGSGQFPLPTQLNSVGAVVIRKSATADGTPRPWTLFADSSTFYLFVLTGDVAGVWFDFTFGDFYSFAGSGDANRTIIIGRSQQNSGVASVSYGGLDCLCSPFLSSTFKPNAGAFVCNSLAGTAGSLNVALYGDMAKSLNPGAATGNAGIIPCPNPFDASYYLSPIFICDSSLGIRGMLRGLYHVCHPLASFVDGQVFSGANDYAGKAFQIIKAGQSGVGLHCIETSAAVATN